MGNTNNENDTGNVANSLQETTSGIKDAITKTGQLKNGVTGQKNKPHDSPGNSANAIANNPAADKAKGAAGKAAGKAIKDSGGKMLSMAADAALPGAGRAIEAAKKGAEVLKKLKGVHNEHPKSSKGNTKGPNASISGTYSSKESSNPAIKVVLFILLPLIIFVVLFMMLFGVLISIVTPILGLFNYIKHIGSSSTIIPDYVLENPSDENVDGFLISQIQEALDGAYNVTLRNELTELCNDETYQYDLELTLASLDECVNPYVYVGDNCNVNYAEIMSVFSLSNTYGQKNFDFELYTNTLNDEEFRKTLYSVVLIPSIGEDKNGNSVAYLKVVYVGKYNLKKMMDYLGIMPNNKSIISTGMTNLEAIKYLSEKTHSVRYKTNWGSTMCSPYYSSTEYQAALTDNGLTTSTLLHEDATIGDDETQITLPAVYAQSNSQWGRLKYGSGTMSNNGCCVTSMSMVLSYFSNQTVTPNISLGVINSKHGGSLYRSKLAAEYGVTEYVHDAKYDYASVAKQLKSERLVLLHIRYGGISPDGKAHPRGHWIVCDGFNTKDSNNVYLHISDPAGGKQYTMSSEFAAQNIDTYSSYGK